MLTVEEWLTFIGLGAVAIYLVQRFRRRAVDPDGQDPARHLLILLIAGCPVLALAIVVAGIVVVNVVGIVALLLVLLVGVLLLGGVLGLAVYLWVRAEDLRRETGYVICEASYLGAPRYVKKTMRRIYSSARSMRDGTAYQTGAFGDMPLDQLVYSAATHAVISAELATAIADLTVAGGGSDRDRAALTEAQRKLQEIHAYLKDVDESLTRAASSLKDFSDRLDEPERQRIAEVKRSEARLVVQERRNEARDRLDAITAQANSKARIDSAEVEDRVAAVNIGHREAQEASDAVLNGPTLPATESAPEAKRPLVSPETKAAARKNALKATKWTAEKASRLSAGAAKLAAEQLEKRSREE